MEAQLCLLSRHSCTSTQFVPLPRKPSLQLHRYPPGKFSQVALSWQLLSNLEKHSSTSSRKREDKKCEEVFQQLVFGEEQHWDHKSTEFGEPQHLARSLTLSRAGFFGDHSGRGGGGGGHKVPPSKNPVPLLRIYSSKIFLKACPKLSLVKKTWFPWKPWFWF